MTEPSGPDLLAAVRGGVAVLLRQAGGVVECAGSVVALAAHWLADRVDRKPAVVQPTRPLPEWVENADRG